MQQGPSGRFGRVRLSNAAGRRAGSGLGIGAPSETPASVTVLDPPPEPITRDRSASPASDRAAARRARWHHYLVARSPLAVVLAVQTALSLRLVWSNTAFQDEGLYLRAGHLEWAGWLHGAPVPDFPSYFSGAPVVYPPIGALADNLGGLAAARILSLCLMLGVTAFLWASTVRLYGRRAALLATGLFATLAGTQFLGAFATYDPMSLFLLTMALWLGIRSADCKNRARPLLLLSTAICLALANAAQYMTALFAPILLVILATVTWRQQGGRAAWKAAVTVACIWLALIAIAIHVAGHQYWVGITTSTLYRTPSGAAANVILQRAYIWMSLILVLAVLGALLAFRSRDRGRFLPGVLAVAALLIPIEQARLHTTLSLQKHVVFGAWFAAIAAGYAMARLSRVDPGRGWAPVMAIPIVASTMFGSIGRADALHSAWPNSSALIHALRPAVQAHPGKYLAEDFDVEAYYLRDEAPWQRWTSTYYFTYQGDPAGAISYAAAIRQHYFALIILDFGDTSRTDRQIVADMSRTGGYYVVLTHVGAFTIWAAADRALSTSSGKHHVVD
jgi:hypothetical protein